LSQARSREQARIHPVVDGREARPAGTSNPATAGHRRRRIHALKYKYTSQLIYRSADTSLALPTSRCILFDCENISFDASLVIYMNSNNIQGTFLLFQTDAHNDKITGKLKQLKFRLSLRHVSVHAGTIIRELFRA
jgi:hypothetical protein